MEPFILRALYVISARRRGCGFLVVEDQEAIRAGQTYWVIAHKVFGSNMKQISRDPQIYVTDLSPRSEGGGTLFQVTDMTEYMTNACEISNQPLEPPAKFCPLHRLTRDVIRHLLYHLLY
jgi:hypothetical protein